MCCFLRDLQPATMSLSTLPKGKSRASAAVDNAVLVYVPASRDVEQTTNRLGIGTT